jgi:hypothetical protein
MNNKMIPGLLPGFSMWGATCGAPPRTRRNSPSPATANVYDGKSHAVEAFMKIFPVEKSNGEWISACSGGFPAHACKAGERPHPNSARRRH